MSAKEHLVSVIIPVYNREDLLPRALDSVAEQTYRPIELIVVDDGSTDGSGEEARRWADTRRDPSFDVRVIHQENSGAPAARNRGLAEAEGRLVQYLDSDDQLLPKKTEKQVAALQSSDADYAFAVTEYRTHDGSVTGHLGRARRAGRPWIAELTWSTSSLLVADHVCDAIGPWDEKLRGAQEFEYGARIKANSFDHVFIDEVLDVHFDHDQASITKRDFAVYGAAIEEALSKILELLPEDASNLAAEKRKVSRDLAICSLRYARIGEVERARNALKKASRVSPAPSSSVLKGLSRIPTDRLFTLSLEGSRLAGKALETLFGHRPREADLETSG